MSFNSYHLKYIALATMLLDHIGIVFHKLLDPGICQILRSIGRLSFPIFCFLLVEGFFHTRDRHAYLFRLCLFGLLSEIPFDLAIKNGQPDSLLSLMDWSRQNVFLTLALGFAAMLFLEYYHCSNMALVVSLLGFSSLGEFLHTDYGGLGVCTILMFYLWRKTGHFPLWVCLLPLLTVSFDAPIQAFCIFSCLFLYRYNGERGNGPRYLFYLAYPLHLLLFYGVKVFIL